MGTITTTDGTEIFYKDWGSGQPLVFSHGWPLSADDWDTQMLFFLQHGYRVVAMTAVVTAAPRRPAVVTTWITTPTTWPRWSSISIFTTPCISATRPAAARSCATSPGTARAGSRRRY